MSQKRSSKRGSENSAASSSSSGDTVVRSVGDGSSAISSFTSALNDAKFSDVTFVVGAKEYHAHRSILAARSEVFYSMLYGGMKESFEKRVEVEGVDPDNFFIILQWAYTGRAQMTAREVLGVLRLALFYGFPDLEDHCRTLATGFIDAPNVVSLLDAAIDIGEDAIVSQALEYMQEHATTTVTQPSWLTLCKAGVEHVLRLKTMDCSECLLYDRTMDWIQHNCEDNEENEKSLLATFLPLIRLPQLSVQDLLEKVKPVVTSRQVHFTEYVEALEYKLCPQHFFPSPSVVPPNELSFRSRTPTLVGKISQNVSISFLDGWTVLVEQDSRLPLDEEKIRAIHPSAVTYICAGERVRGANTIALIGIGRVDVAVRKSSSQQHFFADDSIYWVNLSGSTFGFSATPDQRSALDLNPVGREKRFMWTLQAAGANVSAAATGGAFGFSPENKVRFLCVR